MKLRFAELRFSAQLLVVGLILIAAGCADTVGEGDIDEVSDAGPTQEAQATSEARETERVRSTALERSTLTAIAAETVEAEAATAEIQRTATAEAERLVVTLGDGPSYQVVSAEGPRYVTVAVKDGKLETVDLALYRLPSQDFVALASRASTAGTSLMDLATEPAVVEWTGKLDDPIDIYKQSASYRTALPRGGEIGTYVLAAGRSLSDGAEPEDVLAMLLTTDLVVAKHIDGQLAIWTSSTSGENVDGLHVKVLDGGGEPLVTGQTDESGVYRVDVGPSPDRPLTAVVSREGRPTGIVTVAREGGEGELQSWQEGWTKPRPGRYVVHVQTDRWVYHPEDVVRFRVFALVAAEGLVPVSSGTPIEAYFDAVDTRAASLSTDSMGSAEGALSLPAPELLVDPTEARLVISVKGERHGWPIKIRREPQPVDGTITLTTDRNAYAVGDPITIQMQYFDGEGLPAAGAHIQLTSYARDEDYGWYQYPWIEGVRTTDSNGAATVASVVGPVEGAGTEWHQLTDKGSVMLRRLGAVLVRPDGESESEPAATIAEFAVLASAETPVWAGSPWGRRITGSMRLQPHKAAYDADETAGLLAEPPVDGTCWLTLERMGVYRDSLIDLDPSGRITLPLTEADAPNSFVSVFCRPRAEPESGSAAVTEIEVREQPPTLEVAVTASCEPCLAGDDIHLATTVLDEAGRPAAARLHVSMADQISYELDGRRPRTVAVSLFAPRAYGIETLTGSTPRDFGIVHRPVVDEDLPELVSEPAQQYSRQIGWWSSLQSDEDGVALVPVRLPDIAALWRFSVTAIAEDGRMGDASLVIAATD